MTPGRKGTAGGKAASSKGGEARPKKGPDAVALTSEELEELIAELETRLDRLRALYDMYFMGIERLEPNVQKKDVERRMHDLRRIQIRNTGLRFRFNMLVQRFNTMQTYWMRVARAIEEGRYRRDVMKTRERLGAKPVLGRRRKRRDDEYELDESDIEPVVEEDAGESLPADQILPVERPQPATGKTQGGLVFRRPRSESAMPAVRLPRPKEEGGGLTETRIRELYSRYLEVRKECKESTDNVRFEKMAKALRGMMPELEKKAGGRKVDFEVTVKNGKAFLKPVAK